MSPIQQPRRKFLQLSLTGMITSLFGGMTNTSFAGEPYTTKGIVVREEEGLHILTGRRKIPMNIKISKAGDGVNNLSFCVEDMTPGRRMRVHKHLYNDELIFIHKGEGTLTLDDRIYEVKTGDVVFIPKGIWHGLHNTGREELRMLFQYTPAGFEQYFIENGTVVGTPVKERTAEQYAATQKKYGMVYKEEVVGNQQ